MRHKLDIQRLWSDSSRTVKRLARNVLLGNHTDWIMTQPNAERIQRLIASVREELERNAPKTSKNVADGPMGG
jgi:uncharacterized protein YeeX (DUF496 family)